MKIALWRVSAHYGATWSIPQFQCITDEVVKRTGDGSLIEFRSMVDAVRCAIEVQNAMVERNVGVSLDKRIEFRVEIHLGDVVEESDGDLMGDGVNIASRLEAIAEPNGVCVSSAAYEQVRDKLQHQFVDLGLKELKNIARPVHTYSVVMDHNGARSGSGVPEKPRNAFPTGQAIDRGLAIPKYRRRP